MTNPDTEKIQLMDKFENVTVLFADIAGFTKYSSTVDPQIVVHLLRNLFYEFDKYCIENDVFKLYTIGDCYVVIGFTDIRKRDPVQEAINVVTMAF